MDPILQRFYLTALKRMGKNALVEMLDQILDSEQAPETPPRTVHEIAEYVTRHYRQAPRELAQIVFDGFKDSLHQQAFCRVLRGSAAANKQAVEALRVGTESRGVQLLHARELDAHQYQLLFSVRVTMRFLRGEEGRESVVQLPVLFPAAVLLSGSRLVYRVMSLQTTKWSEVVGQAVTTPVKSVSNKTIVEMLQAFMANEANLQDVGPHDFSARAIETIRSDDICTYAGEHHHHDNDGEPFGYTEHGTVGSLRGQRECLRERMPEKYEELVSADALKYCECRTANDFHGIPADSGFALRPSVGLIIITARPEGGDLNEFFRFLVN